MLVGACGVRHELNLRGAEEANRTTSPLGSDVWFYCPTNFVWYSLTDKTTWKEILLYVIKAVTHNEPVYFHCSAGADRTGTVACLLEALLGMSRSDIDKDYELTCFSTGTDTDAHARRRNETDWKNLITAINQYTGSSFRDKAVSFVTACGVPISKVNAFRATMISGDAGEVVVPPQEYTVTNTLTGCTSSNAATTVTEGDAYYATITASNGYVLNGATVTVKMGGTDVTALYYADGIINIPDVSGNIEITITAAVYVPTYTNVLPTAVDPSTKSGVWDGKGYLNGAYASSAKPYYGTDAAYWCTGAIALQPSDVIYVKGTTLEGSGHARLGAFSGTTDGCYFCKEYVALSGMAMVTKLGDKYYKIVLDHSYANYTNIGYIMFSAQGTGDGVVVTKNEAIE